MVISSSRHLVDSYHSSFAIIITWDKPPFLAPFFPTQWLNSPMRPVPARILYRVWLATFVSAQKSLDCWEFSIVNDNNNCANTIHAMGFSKGFSLEKWFRLECAVVLRPPWQPRYAIDEGNRRFFGTCSNHFPDECHLSGRRCIWFQQQIESGRSIENALWRSGFPN